MKLLLLLAVLGFAGAAPPEDGKVCEPHSRPWQVYLEGKGCSAALINEWWIVTSMECAPLAHKTIAVLGEYDLSADEGTEQRILIADVIRHSPYRSPLHSLTVARLAERARFNQYVQPIPLPTRCPQPGETCHVSGWGSTNPDKYDPRGQMKCITVPVVDDQTCLNTFPEFIYWSIYMVCAGRANTDNCLDDGAGVMVCDGQLQGVRWFNHGCYDPAHPTVYSKLCLYNGWIRDVMNNFTPTTTRAPTPPPRPVA